MVPKILVVEDDETSFYLIKEILSDTSAQIIHKKNGIDAQNYMQTNTPSIDLIIMDIVLPLQDGITTTEIIRETNKSLPIIAVSADPSEKKQKRCLNAGCNAFLGKPLNIEHFLNKVKELLPVKA